MNKPLTNQREMELKRLRFRSSHRGFKETDLVLGRFADSHLESLTEAELGIYALLVEENDADIWEWLVGKTPPTRPEYTPLLERLRQFTA